MTFIQSITIIVLIGVPLSGYLISVERRLTAISQDVKWIVRTLNGKEKG